MNSDTTLKQTDGTNLLNAVDKLVIENDGTDITIEAGAFDPANTSFENLKAIQTAASNATVKIADNGSATGSVIDLKQFSTVEGLKSFTVEGDGGANIIQLSSALSTSGITSVDLGDDDRLTNCSSTLIRRITSPMEPSPTPRSTTSTLETKRMISVFFTDLKVEFQHQANGCHR